jgi:HPt (histidine-containing phosphotransfer) domain-containing protein
LSHSGLRKGNGDIVVFTGLGHSPGIAVYPKYLAELRGAVVHRDAAQLAHCAHSLKGAVAVLHATTAYSLAAVLETSGPAARLENVPTVLEKLDEELTRIIAFFAEYESRGEHHP